MILPPAYFAVGNYSSLASVHGYVVSEIPYSPGITVVGSLPSSLCQGSNDLVFQPHLKNQLKIPSNDLIISPIVL
jgi:hypothetical protein